MECYSSMERRILGYGDNFFSYLVLDEDQETWLQGDPANLKHTEEMDTSWYVEKEQETINFALDLSNSQEDSEQETSIDDIIKRKKIDQKEQSVEGPVHYISTSAILRVG